MEIAGGLGISAADIDGTLTVICAHAEEQVLRPNWHPVLPNDPDDEPLVQLAFESGAGLIVTHNVSHLQAADTLGIKVLRPRDFIAKIRQSL